MAEQRLELGQQYQRRKFHALRLAAMELLRECRYDEQTRGPVMVNSDRLRDLYRALE